jgi:phosphatidylserine/phosphatidylglycerophosphate/cardiolipin synthase-like enzyme
MSLVYVGLPMLQHTRRFHFDRGRRWNVVEHLVLQALARSSRTAGELAEQGSLPRRVILEVLIRLMRAGWVELRADSREVNFYATRRGKAVAHEDELPANTERMARRMSFAVDMLTGSIFRRRDLTLLWPNEWQKRTEAHGAVVVAKPSTPPYDLGHVSTLLGVLFNEDEQLVRVDISDRPPAERIALFSVRDGLPENLPPRAGPTLRSILAEASRRAAPHTASSQAQNSVVIASPTSRLARPERQTLLRQEDFIQGGQAHEAHITSLLKKARRQVIVHSTFLDRNRFEYLLPAFRVAVGHGCKVDILWGHSAIDGGTVKSLHEAEAIYQRLQEAGLSGSINVHRFSTRSHAKLLVADDGEGGTTATVGSCNWLYSGFESYELSVLIRDPHLVGDVLYEIAELSRPRDGQLPEITARLAQAARELQGRPALTGNAVVRVLVGDEHDDCVLEARDSALHQITVLSHRLGVTAKPSIVIPVSAAAKLRNVDVKLYYGQPSGPVKQQDATSASWTFREQGVDLVAVHRPRIHAKALLWDDDHVVVTSLNWLSADTPVNNPRQEIGIAVRRSRAAALLREAFHVARTFV